MIRCPQCSHMFYNTPHRNVFSNEEFCYCPVCYRDTTNEPHYSPTYATSEWERVMENNGQD